jgi:hypothetical protein
MSTSTVSAPSTVTRTSGPTCTCAASDPRPGAERGRLLLRLDLAVDAGQVTPAEAAERRVQLLTR